MTNTTITYSSWYERAGCRGLPSNLFFLDCERQDANTYKAKLRATQSICAQCEVLSKCFKQALALDERYGVWGGVDFQPRGKPNRNMKRRMKFLHEQHDMVVRKSKEMRKEA